MFRLDPEMIHDFTLLCLGILGAVPVIRGVIERQFAPRRCVIKPINAFGLSFPNPLGLAAGYDKNGYAWRGLSALGFGHIEIGTVTLHPQNGNPKPRIFRIPDEQAIINRMGFPSRGAKFVADRLTRTVGKSAEIILGINLGKNKDTSIEEAAADYIALMRFFSPIADYLVINISSPNTIGLRQLQAREYLESLLTQLLDARLTLKFQRPILVKLAPDLTDTELDDALEIILDLGLEGIIATNTTISRRNLRSNIGSETGGLSGAPLTGTSREVVAKIYDRTKGKIPIIGVGGIMTPDDAKAMLEAGATLVQIYTGLIYAGPGVVRQILETL
jgi:dihydroorotate dehydrogenase